MTAREATPSVGDRLHGFASTLYPICRSITGNGVRETLSLISQRVPLKVHEVPSGTPVFDWTVPDEWNISAAWLEDPAGRRVVDFKDSNLHVLNYSEPVDATLSLDELRPHLFSLPDKPEWIPYKTSYYRRTWGFCLAHRELDALPAGTYRAHIDATLKPGNLTYGECFIPGRTKEEVLFSAHVCHPSLANDNLSGIAVLTELAEWLAQQDLRYSYRLLFIPGTIGSITWLARNQEIIKRVRCGLVASLLGDKGHFTYKKTRSGDSDIDYLVPYVLAERGHCYETIDFFPYGYDERQFGSPGIGLAVGNLTRSQFGSFPEYHTSRR